MTQSSEIYDFFLSTIDDFRIDSIMATSGSMVAGEYMEPFLLHSIEEFEICTQDLEFTVATDDDEGFFTETLTMKHKLMLSLIMTKYWLLKDINNLLAFSNLLQDRDFKRHSSANSLSSRRNFYNQKCEEISQRLTDYEYKDVNNWSQWRNQVYY